MKKLFKWLLFLTGILAVGVAVILYNPGLIKEPLESYLSDIAGYPISLEGELEIDPGRLTEFTATNIRISAPDWAGNRNLISADYVRLVLDTASVFEDIVVIDDLQLDRLQLNLETRADGAGNWIRANMSPPTDDETDSDPAVVFNNVRLNDTSLYYRNGVKDLEHVFHVDSLNQHQQPDGMMQITLGGSFNDRPVEFEGTIGPYINMLNGQNITYTGNGHFGTLDISSNGLIDDLLKPKHPLFSLEMQGPNIDEITSMFGVDDLGSGEFSLRARGEVVNDHYEAGINGKIGDISLDASAQVSDLLQLDELDLSFSANGPSLGSFTRVFGFQHWPDKPFRLKGDVDRLGGTLNITDLTLGIGGTELILDALLTNFPHLDASRINLSVSGDDVTQFRDLLGIPGVATGQFDIHGSLDTSSDDTELLQVEVNTSLGRATLSGTLGAAPTYAGSQLHLHLDGNNAHSLMSVFGIDALPEQPFSLDSHIETVENGLFLERGVLVTIEDERLELGGFIAFRPGGKGTDIEARLNGQHLAQMLQRLVGDIQVPDTAYDISGHVRVVEEGVELENIKAEYADIELSIVGLIPLREQLQGTGLDFKIKGKNFSALSNFEAIGDTLDFIVPGQSYQATGHLMIENSGWQLKGVSGRIGKTALNFDSRISNRPKWSGSNVHFSIKGPDFHSLLIDRDESDQPLGAFESSGQIMLSDDTLSINDFDFKTAKTHGEVDLELSRPVESTSDASFNVNVWGDDIGHLLPRMQLLEPKMATYHIKADGQKQGKLISLKHFNADIGNLRVTLKGTVDKDPTDESVDITFRAISKDLSTLGQMNGRDLPALALDLKADYKGNVHQFVLQNFSGTLGENDIRGMLDVSLTGSKPKIRLTAKSDYIDIRPFLEPADRDDKAVIAKSRERLIPATPLPLEALAAVDMTTRLDIAELRYLKDSIKNLALEAELQNGHLKVPLLSLDGPKGKLGSSFSISPTGNSEANVKVDLNAENIVFNLSGQPTDKLHQSPAVDIDFHAIGTGGNLQELAGTTNGTLYMGSEGGTLEGVDLGLLDTFLIEDIINTIMPHTDTKDDLEITCAATALKIEDGLVKTAPALALTTKRITLISKGTLDLKTEKMHFNFNATPNKALKLSPSELFNPYILVSGTLSKPEVGLDPAKVLLHGGAAIGTAGVSILAKGLLDRIGTTVPLCEEMLEEARKEH